MIIYDDKKSQNYPFTRIHGWDRGITKNNNDFNFINSGFNLR